MLRKTMILLPAALLGVLPVAASAESMDKAELDMLRGTTVTINQAAEAALKAHSGTLAAVAFGEEGGRAAYEAIVIGDDGQPWMVLVDAKTGEAFASALASSMEENENGVNGGDDDGDGETDDD